MENGIIRVGLIGAGANTRLRHIPGLREQEGVEIVAVANRSLIVGIFSTPLASPKTGRN